MLNSLIHSPGEGGTLIGPTVGIIPANLKADVQVFTNDGAILASSTTFTSSSATFKTTDVGKYIVIAGAGVSPFYVLSGTVGSSGGSNNVVGDVLTVTTGTGTAAEFSVATINSGAVLTVTLINAGSYTVLPTTTNVTTTSSNGGATPPNLNLIMVGAPLATTIQNFTNSSTVVLTAAATNAVSNATKWYYGSDDSAALQTAINSGSAVYLPSSGKIGVASTVTMGSSGSMLIGSGLQTSVIALGTLTTAPIEFTGQVNTTPGGGGLRDLTVDAFKLAPYSIYVNSRTRHNFYNVAAMNATTAEWKHGDGSTQVEGNWFVTIFGSTDVSVFSLGQGSASNWWNVNATDSYIIGAIFSNAIGIANLRDDSGGVNHYIQPHMFGTQNNYPAGLATYCAQIHAQTILVSPELDSFITAGVYITASGNQVIGGFVINGGATLPAVTLASGVKNNVILGVINPSATPVNTITSVSNPPDPSNIIMGNPGASLFSIGAFPTLIPQGRLTLSSTAPIMTSDVVNGATVYYLPFAGQYLPVYHGAYGSLIPVSIGAGLSLALDSTNTDTGYQASGNIYDLFIAFNSGSLVLCTGPAWTTAPSGTPLSGGSRGTGANSTQLNQTQQGIWTNSHSITVRFGNSTGNTFTLAANNGTWVGSIYCSGNGEVTVQFGLNSTAGGPGNIIGLYNAYNQIMLNSSGQDSNTAWTNTSANWAVADAANTATGNQITVLDAYPNGGMFVNATYTVDAEISSGGVAAIGISRNSTPSAPSIISVSNSATFTQNAVAAAFIPLLGLNYYQAMERNAAGAGTVTFNKSAAGMALTISCAA